MKGIEKGPDGKLRYYYQYKSNGPKYYYIPKNDPRGRIGMAFKRPYYAKPPRKERETWYSERPRTPPPPPPSLSPREQMLKNMPLNVQRLITRWLLIMGLPNINVVSPDEVNKAFRMQSLIHHPDRGGREESYKELTSVRDHLLTLCAMADEI